MRATCMRCDAARFAAMPPPTTGITVGRYRSYGFLQSRVKRAKRKRDYLIGLFGFGNEVVE